MGASLACRIFYTFSFLRFASLHFLATRYNPSHQTLLVRCVAWASSLSLRPSFISLQYQMHYRWNRCFLIPYLREIHVLIQWRVRAWRQLARHFTVMVRYCFANWFVRPSWCYVTASCVLRLKFHQLRYGGQSKPQVTVRWGVTCSAGVVVHKHPCHTHTRITLVFALTVSPRAPPPYHRGRFQPNNTSFVMSSDAPHIHRFRTFFFITEIHIAY